MFYHISALVVLCAVQATARLVRRDTVYTTSSKDSSLAASFGTAGSLTTVNAGVYRYLSGQSPHNFFGNINNYGSITASQSDAFLITVGMLSGWTHTTDGNLNNYGAISLNDYNGIGAATYQWYLNNMENAGSLQWCARGDTVGSSYQLYCDNTCYNDGVIDWEQYNGNTGILFTWRNTALINTGSLTSVLTNPIGATPTVGAIPTGQANIVNNGAFRLINVDFQGVQNVYGTGCWVLGAGSTLYLQDGAGLVQNPNLGPTYPNQSIYFTSNTATLHLNAGVYTANPNFGPQIYGFAAGNAIEFLEIVSVFSYDVTTGIMTVTMTTGNIVYLKLGLGYNAASFSLDNNLSLTNPTGLNAIFYSGLAPAQSIPSKCQVALPTCTNPASTATVAAAIVTTTLPYTGAQTLTGPITQTIAAASGTRLGTVAVYTPGGNTVTLTSLGTAVGPSTSTVARATGTVPGTVVVYTPGAYVTTTQFYTGVGLSTSTAALPAGTAPGTVVVYTPGAYVTTTQLYTGVGLSTSTAAQPTGLTPGTVVVYAPGAYVTTTQLYTGIGLSTSTAAQPTGTTPGTVVVYNPGAYVTTTLPYAGLLPISVPLTSTIAAPVGTVPGTVAVFTPATSALVTPTLTTPTIASPTVTTPTIASPTVTTPTITSPSVTIPTTTASSRPATLATAFGPDQCVCVPV